MKDSEFLNWLAARLVFVYGENENVDFVHKVRALAAEAAGRESAAAWRKESQRIRRAILEREFAIAMRRRDVLERLSVKLFWKGRLLASWRAWSLRDS